MKARLRNIFTFLIILNLSACIGLLALFGKSNIVSLEFSAEIVDIEKSVFIIEAVTKIVEFIPRIFLFMVS